MSFWAVPKNHSDTYAERESDQRQEVSKAPGQRLVDERCIAQREGKTARPNDRNSQYRATRPYTPVSICRATADQRNLDGEERKPRSQDGPMHVEIPRHVGKAEQRPQIEGSRESHQHGETEKRRHNDEEAPTPSHIPQGLPLRRRSHRYPLTLMGKSDQVFPIQQTSKVSQRARLRGKHRNTSKAMTT